MFFLASVLSLVFLAAFWAIHLIRSDLSFSKNPLSKYGIGEKSWLLAIGFLAIGFAQIVLSVGLTNFYVFSLGNMLLILAGAGAVVVSIFKMKLPKTNVAGHIHALGAVIQFSLFPFALVILNNIVPNDTLSFFTIAVCGINFLLIALMSAFVVVGKVHNSAYFGLIQKVNIIIMSVWVLVISLYFSDLF
jgi:hypothetical protein